MVLIRIAAWCTAYGWNRWRVTLTYIFGIWKDYPGVWFILWCFLLLLYMRWDSQFVCGCAQEGNDSHLVDYFSVSKMSSLYKSQSMLHEQVWWRNEFCKGSPGEWYTGKIVQSKTIVLHRYNLMCVLYTDELLSIQWWWKIVWLHLEGGCLLYGLRRYSGVLEG